MSGNGDVISLAEALAARALEGRRRHLERLRHIWRIIRARIRATAEEIRRLEGRPSPKG